MTTRVRVLTRNASRALSRRRAQTSQKQKCSSSSSGSKLHATVTRAKLLQQQRQRSAATAAAAAANGSNEVTKSSTTTATRHAQPPGEVLRVTAHAVRTPVGVFSVCVDDAGAVRLCNWLPSHTRDSVQAALAEVYKGYTLDVHIVTESSSSGDDDTMTNDQQQQQHTPEAVQLLQAYFDTAPSLSRGNSSAADVSALHALLSRVAVVLPPHATPFTKAVWQTLRQSVAAGEVVTYKQLGERVVTQRQQQQQQQEHKNMIATTAAASRRTHYARAVGRAMATNPIVVVVPCHRVLASSHTLHGYSCGLHRKVWLLQHEHAAGVSACELQRWQGVQRPYAQQ